MNRGLEGRWQEGCRVFNLVSHLPLGPSGQACRLLPREVLPPFLPFGAQMDQDQFGGGQKTEEPLVF